MNPFRDNTQADSPAAGTVLQNSHPVSVASLAPSFPLAFDAPADQILEDLKKAGFSAVEETSSVLRQNWNLRMKELETNPFLIGSSCPKVADLVHHNFIPLTDFLSRLPSPMEQHGRSLRRRYPRARLFFFSPCEAKVEENWRSGVFDQVFEFSVLAGMITAPRRESPALRREVHTLEEPPVEARLAVLNSPVSGENECRWFLQEALSPEFRILNPGYHDLALCRGGCAGRTAEQFPSRDPAEVKLLRAWDIDT